MDVATADKKTTVPTKRDLSKEMYDFWIARANLVKNQLSLWEYIAALPDDSVVNLCDICKNTDFAIMSIKEFIQEGFDSVNGFVLEFNDDYSKFKKYKYVKA